MCVSMWCMCVTGTNPICPCAFHVCVSVVAFLVCIAKDCRCKLAGAMNIDLNKLAANVPVFLKHLLMYLYALDEKK